MKRFGYFGCLFYILLAVLIGVVLTTIKSCGVAVGWVTP